MIEYGKNTRESKLTFGMVGIDQFFYNKDGWLCQKINSTKYVTIAKSDGMPYSYTQTAFSEKTIKAICKKVTKISIEIEQGER